MENYSLPGESRGENAIFGEFHTLPREVFGMNGCGRPNGSAIGTSSSSKCNDLDR